MKNISTFLHPTQYSPPNFFSHAHAIHFIIIYPNQICTFLFATAVKACACSVYILFFIANVKSVLLPGVKHDHSWPNK